MYIARWATPIEEMEFSVMRRPEMATVSEAFIVRQAIITAIVRDGSCTPSNAGNVLKSIEYIIAMIREMGYQPVSPTFKQLSVPSRRICEKLMADGKLTRPASAYQLIVSHFLNSQRGETGLAYTKAGNDRNGTASISFQITRSR
jgi:hypothetical protein